MKLTVAIPLAFASLGLAAPTSIDKHLLGQLTLFTGQNWTGASITLSISTDTGGICSKSPFFTLQHLKTLAKYSIQRYC